MKKITVLAPFYFIFNQFSFKYSKIYQYFKSNKYYQLFFGNIPKTINIYKRYQGKMQMMNQVLIILLKI